ncbi:metallophosphoesterase [Qipengyuania sediminis]|uniref:metallophosphoesterase n=1 Tax=Qipengyuania sediminis TaxID=1532023 RepID=UPI001059D993|nr:metallophosphoesterase [Qipengyuania sediminis]
MLRSLARLFRPPAAAPAARVPEGERWYAIGDIHGRQDLFAALVAAIEADDRAAAPARSQVVLLGDLVDRGPDSAGVIAHARTWAAQRPVRLLAGNHEEMFLESFGDLEMLRHFLRHGGRETVLSYGIDRKTYDAMSLEEVQVAMQEIVPEEDRAFLTAAEEWIEAGDYLFVHAGINPALPLAEQRRADLLWIRERFLRHPDAYSHVVVHGHTIFEGVEDTGTRIGIDTGAYRSGRLTALVLEGSARRTIQAVAQDGAIAIERGNS